MRKWIVLVLIVAIGATLLFFTQQGKVIKNTALTYVTKPTYVNESGRTVADRVIIPENYTRANYDSTSFSHYVQHYPLLPSGAKIINFDGKPYVYQQGHIGVLDISVPSNGLQQCADALIRIRAEYLWEQNRQDEIAFNFTSGHRCSWMAYAKGFRPKINGNKVSFYQTAAANHSKENFYNYLHLIYTYSGTQSLFDELPQITSAEDIEVGDMVIKPGSPGHVMMVVDKVVANNDSILFIFAQGNTPAQRVHLLKNPNDAGMSPWYEIALEDPLTIPTYFFEELEIIRFN